MDTPVEILSDIRDSLGDLPERLAEVLRKKQRTPKLTLGQPTDSAGSLPPVGKQKSPEPAKKKDDYTEWADHVAERLERILKPPTPAPMGLPAPPRGSNQRESANPAMPSTSSALADMSDSPYTKSVPAPGTQSWQPQPQLGLAAPVSAPKSQQTPGLSPPSSTNPASGADEDKEMVRLLTRIADLLERMDKSGNQQQQPGRQGGGAKSGKNPAFRQWTASTNAAEQSMQTAGAAPSVHITTFAKGARGTGNRTTQVKSGQQSAGNLLAGGHGT